MAKERLSKRAMYFGAGTIGPENVPLYRDVTLTNAQMLALRATPVTLVPTPTNASALVVFHSAILVSSAAAGAWTETADNLVIRQTNTTGVIVSDTIETTGFIDGTAIKATFARPKLDPIGMLLGKALVLHNSGDGEFGGGNAASTLKVRIFYSVNVLGFGTLA